MRVEQAVHAPNGEGRDVNDHAQLRHARERTVGFEVGQYLQPPPMLFTRDGHNLFLGDMYRGASAFLVCSGPSLNSHNLSFLSDRGLLTMAVNNAATMIRPNLWCCVDDPGNFCDAIWYDAGITKFTPFCHMEKHFTIRNDEGGLVKSPDKVGDMPSVIGFRRNEAFAPEQFLTEDTFNWGNHGDRLDSLGNKGSRSVMYVAIRLLYYLGVRTIYLIGCDFKMKIDQQNYAFPQERSRSSVKGNNESYQILNKRLQSLLPYFERAGLSIFNCTPDSGLKVFPHKPYVEAVEEAKARISTVIDTNGMYDRQAKQKTKRTQNRSVNVHTEAINPIDRLSELPDITLVVPIRKADEQNLKHSWQTWLKFKPWILEFPILVLRTDDVSELYLREVMSDSPNLLIEKITPHDDSCQSWERAKVFEVPSKVNTEWFWMLDTTALATSKQDWLSPDVFSKNGQRRAPDIIACSWGYTKPAGIYLELDDWANHISLFQDHPALNWQPDGNSDRIRHDAISSWSFMANTRLSELVADAVDDSAPIKEHASFMLFCAARLRKIVHRIPMKKYGWDHSFGWNTNQIERRSRELLTVTQLEEA